MITLDNVTKTYKSAAGDFHAVRNVSFTVNEGELAVLIGPSGSGKTTTMRMINRLEKATSGTISVNGQDINSLNVVELRRHIGYVIQQGGLLPHFTVAENVALVPRLLGWDKKKRRARAEELLALVDLDPAIYADRFPRQLSGGQQQRVGVARALAADAPIILMDEPFGAVDPITRNQLQRWLRQVQRDVRKTIVFVTHDINEAFLLGDRIILMKDGQIAQNGSPADLLRTPASDFVKEFIGDEFALQALEHTYIAELARPFVPDVPDDALVIPGDMSIPEASREITQAESTGHDGFWVANDNGEPDGYVTYEDFANVLSEGIASEVEAEEADTIDPELLGEEERAHAVHS
ncbi:MAG TPA: ATP-binding cassette domain-containing protein [Thermomicrobiales bacterium]|nr:ATP-binding cassette domain-containing protein [Thermomicrobiales bacterium]